jgi:hypothetical protein
MLLFTATFSLSAAAGNENDTIFYHEKNGTKTYIKRNSVFKGSKYYSDLFLDFGYNRLDNRNMFTGAGDVSAAGFPKLRNSASKSFSIYAMFGRKISGAFSVMSGLGFDWVNYRFSKDVTLREIDGYATQVPIASVVSNFSYMRKSKLAGSYINVPVLLKIRFHRRFFVAAGVVGGLNIGSHTTVAFTDKYSNKHSFKNYDIHLATFRYGYTARAGFSFLSLFANYYVSPLFSKNEGPQVYPFAMGIALKL